MASFSDLPVEVLEHILSFLPLDACKQASLVCRQWLSLCSSRKCMAKVLLKLEPYPQNATDIRRTIASSGRHYRHVLFKSDNDDHNVLIKILKRLKPDLESLTMTSNFEESISLNLDYLKRLFGCLAMLRELRIQSMIQYAFFVPDAKVRLAKMPHLDVLYLEYGTLEESCFDWREIAPNLRHLYMPHYVGSRNFNDMMSFYGQQLCSLGISLGNGEYCSVGEGNTFPHVRRLSVKCTTRMEPEHTTRLFKSFTNLRELSLGHWILPDTLSMIVNSFPSLVTLRLYDALHDDGLQLISKLPNLKILFLSGEVLHLAQLTQADSFNNLEQLALKNVVVDADFDDFFALLHVKMPNVTSLEITEMEIEMETAVACKHLTNLLRLTIVFSREATLWANVFGELSRMTHLQELRIHSTGLQCGFSWTWFSQCPSIRHLGISLEELTQYCASKDETTEWKAFADSFPSLAKFEVAQCKLSAPAMEAIRRQLPNCEVRHVTEMGAFRADSEDATLQFRSTIE